MVTEPFAWQMKAGIYPRQEAADRFRPPIRSKVGVDRSSAREAAIALVPEADRFLVAPPAERYLAPFVQRGKVNQTDRPVLQLAADFDQLGMKPIQGGRQALGPPSQAGNGLGRTERLTEILNLIAQPHQLRLTVDNVAHDSSNEYQGAVSLGHGEEAAAA